MFIIPHAQKQLVSYPPNTKTPFMLEKLTSWAVEKIDVLLIFRGLSPELFRHLQQKSIRAF